MMPWHGSHISSTGFESKLLIIVWQDPEYSLTDWEVESENTFETVQKRPRAHRERLRLSGIASTRHAYMSGRFGEHLLFVFDNLIFLWQAINNGSGHEFRSEESMYVPYELSRGEAGSQSSIGTHFGVVELQNPWIRFSFDKIRNFCWQVACLVDETFQNRFIRPCRCRESSVVVWELLESSFTRRVPLPAVFCKK